MISLAAPVNIINNAQSATKLDNSFIAIIMLYIKGNIQQT